MQRQNDAHSVCEKRLVEKHEQPKQAKERRKERDELRGQKELDAF